VPCDEQQLPGSCSSRRCRRGPSRRCGGIAALTRPTTNSSSGIPPATHTQTAATAADPAAPAQAAAASAAAAGGGVVGADEGALHPVAAKELHSAIRGADLGGWCGCRFALPVDQRGRYRSGAGAADMQHGSVVCSTPTTPHKQRATPPSAHGATPDGRCSTDQQCLLTAKSRCVGSYAQRSDARGKPAAAWKASAPSASTALRNLQGGRCCEPSPGHGNSFIVDAGMFSLSRLTGSIAVRGRWPRAHSERNCSRRSTNGYEFRALVYLLLNAGGVFMNCTNCAQASTGSISRQLLISRRQV